MEKKLIEKLFRELGELRYAYHQYWTERINQTPKEERLFLIKRSCKVNQQ